MNARKLFAGLAVLVLTFGITGSATAQWDSEPVSVTLSDSTDPCSIDIYAVGGTFGSWQYDSSAGGYVNTDVTSTIDFYGDLYSYNLLGCDVLITFGGLSNGVDTIDTSYFSAYSVIHGAVPPASWGGNGIGAPGFQWVFYDFSYTLDSVPFVSLGTYSGSIDAYISNTI